MGRVVSRLRKPTRLDTLVLSSLEERRVSSTRGLERLAQWRTRAVSLEAREIYTRVSGSSTHNHLSIKYYTKWLFLRVRNLDFVFYFYGTASD